MNAEQIEAAVINIIEAQTHFYIFMISNQSSFLRSSKITLINQKTKHVVSYVAAEAVWWIRQRAVEMQLCFSRESDGDIFRSAN